MIKKKKKGKRKKKKLLRVNKPKKKSLIFVLKRIRNLKSQEKIKSNYKKENGGRFRFPQSMQIMNLLRALYISLMNKVLKKESTSENYLVRKVC